MTSTKFNRPALDATSASAVPTSGTYSVGDIVWNTAPGTGLYVGWVCTSNSPLTFQGFGAIGAATTPPPPTPSASRPFATDSPWNTPIPASPVLDTNSAAMVTRLAGGTHVADLYEFGVPIYQADANTPKKTITTLNDPAWGTSPFAGKQLPLISSMAPSSGSDAAMIVMDVSTHTSYEFWQYNWNAGSPRTSWGAITDTNGTGAPTSGEGVGSGLSRLAGVVRIAEIQAGQIDHALCFSCDSTAASTNFRYPATKSDGSNAGYAGSDAIPEGARVQLNPSVNVDTISGITAGEKTVAKALQAYGAYCIDVGGARMAFIFEDSVAEGVTDPYSPVGMTTDYFSLSHIPWSSLRVLKTWNGT